MEEADGKLEETILKKEDDDSPDNGNMLLENEGVVKAEPVEIQVEIEECTEEILPDCSYESEPTESELIKVEPDFKYEEEDDTGSKSEGDDMDSEDNNPSTLQEENPELPSMHWMVPPEEPENKKRDKRKDPYKKCRICKRLIPKIDFADHQGGEDCLQEAKKLKVNGRKVKTKSKITSKKIRCGICARVFPNDQTFLTHINVHSDIGTVYKCGCGKMFARKANVHHCKSKKPLVQVKGMLCEICNKIFCNRFIYTLHTEQHRRQKNSAEKIVSKDAVEGDKKQIKNNKKRMKTDKVDEVKDGAAVV